MSVCEREGDGEGEREREREAESEREALPARAPSAFVGEALIQWA